MLSGASSRGSGSAVWEPLVKSKAAVGEAAIVEVRHQLGCEIEVGVGAGEDVVADVAVVEIAEQRAALGLVVVPRFVRDVDAGVLREARIAGQHAGVVVRDP